ncbi:MAG: 4-diphosphocytidyl-2-C-methyl-D-erythritol kinase [Tenericutes bacterium ADurb.Bin087]|nr:MAG: 4-diphosphocytidyl-2-C-methyl-D-erythritol kinase [Tenericutes bacterium ADurb.Bin087]
MIVTANARLSISVKTTLNPLTNALEIKSVVLPIEFSDTITIDGFNTAFMDIVHYTNKALHVKEKRIIDEALIKMRDKFDYKQNFSVKIHKNIPTGHGLGSGASDATSVIKAVAHLAKLKLTPEQYYDLAVNVGKDVPYFLVNKPAVYDLNKQEVIPFKFKHNPYVLLIIHSDIYEKENVVKDFMDYGESLPKQLANVVEVAEKGSLRELGSVLFNDFSETIIKYTPALRAVLNDLKQLNIEAYGIAGTGNTIFALSDNRNLLRFINDKYRKLNYQTVMTRVIK